MVTEGKYTDIIGKKVHVIVDRPAGSYHPGNHGIYYPINYGYIEDIIAGDGSGQDVYILGSDTPLETFDGVVIAVYHRTNDVEDKWIIEEEGTDFSDEEILKTFFGESMTFFCKIKNVQADEKIACADAFDIDLEKLDPVIYSGLYHSIGKLPGKIGDFS